MGSLWDEIGKDRDRRRREQRRTEAWMRKEAAADERHAEREAATATRSNRAEEVRREREAGEEEARARNQLLEARLASFSSVLSACVALPPRTVEFLRQEVPVVEFVAPAPDPTLRRPVWKDFAPAEPGIFGRRKYERAVQEAQVVFARACERFDRIQAERLEAARQAHAAQQAAASEAHRRFWNNLSDGLLQRDPDAVSEFAGAVVNALPPLKDLLSRGGAVYQPEPRELVVEIDLPDTHIVPGERAWRYIQARRAVESSPRSRKIRQIAMLT